MINHDYAAIISQAKKSGAQYVNFTQPSQPNNSVNAYQDKVTLSSDAVNLLNGESTTQTAPTYIKPTTARALLAENKTSTSIDKQYERNSRFDDMLQKILDKRLGVDREKLEEIEAMMREVAENENLSPEQKQKALEELEKVREQMMEESLDVQKQAKHSFNNEQEQEQEQEQEKV